MIDEVIEKIAWLLTESDLTTYKIGKETGLSTQFLDRYKKDPSLIVNMTMAKARILEDYVAQFEKR